MENHTRFTVVNFAQDIYPYMTCTVVSMRNKPCRKYIGRYPGNKNLWPQDFQKLERSPPVSRRYWVQRHHLLHVHHAHLHCRCFSAAPPMALALNGTQTEREVRGCLMVQKDWRSHHKLEYHRQGTLRRAPQGSFNGH